MQSGQRQYEMEGEPVSRHLAKVKKDQNKPAYCFSLHLESMKAVSHIFIRFI